jgi:transketolase
MTERQRELRLFLLEYIYKKGKGSSGRALSSVDLIEALYFGEQNGRQIFRHDARLPQWEERDLFIMSKIEAMPALYAVLNKKGFKLPDVLPETPNRKVPGIELTLEKQGYGICAAVGIAESIKIERKNQYVFCLAADYELDKGEVWEAIMTAAEHRLDRLCLILDENDPRDQLIQERFESFGWKVIKLLDAHDHDEIVYAYMKARITQRKPICIWAPTIKSKGVAFAERKPEYDDVVYSEAEMQEIRNILL